MRKLSKRSVLKKKKQQLIDRINNNKSLKELKGWERTFSYYDVLKDDFDWDYEFLLDLIEFKLKRMSNYFHTHRIVEEKDKKIEFLEGRVEGLNKQYELIRRKFLDGDYETLKNYFMI
jgi:hypothetical protein